MYNIWNINSYTIILYTYKWNFRAYSLIAERCGGRHPCANSVATLQHTLSGKHGQGFAVFLPEWAIFLAIGKELQDFLPELGDSIRFWRAPGKANRLKVQGPPGASSLFYLVKLEFMKRSCIFALGLCAMLLRDKRLRFGIEKPLQSISSGEAVLCFFIHERQCLFAKFANFEIIYYFCKA